MYWSKKTNNLWKAFENAVLARDKNQFLIYHQFVLSKQKDEMNHKQFNNEGEELSK